jgi:hypothetical protein
MNDSLPALSHFAYLMVLPPEELEELMRKHGRKLHELAVRYYDASNVLDVCPALNTLTFSLSIRVGPVCLFHLLMFKSLTA